jgi:hypothetical protein
LLPGLDNAASPWYSFDISRISFEEELMSLDEHEIISAQVILPSAGGRRPNSKTAITSENIRDFQPTAETVAEASKAFTAAGFDVGPAFGNSFSITAPAGTIMRLFKTGLRRTPRGGLQAIREDGSASEELPLERLPESIKRHVVGITFTPPPDFGFGAD